MLAYRKLILAPMRYEYCFVMWGSSDSYSRAVYTNRPGFPPLLSQPVRLAEPCAGSCTEARMPSLPECSLSSAFFSSPASSSRFSSPRFLSFKPRISLASSLLRALASSSSPLSPQFSLAISSSLLSASPSRPLSSSTSILALPMLSMARLSLTVSSPTPQHTDCWASSCLMLWPMCCFSMATILLSRSSWSSAVGLLAGSRCLKMDRSSRYQLVGGCGSSAQLTNI